MPDSIRNIIKNNTLSETEKLAKETGFPLELAEIAVKMQQGKIPKQDVDAHHDEDGNLVIEYSDL
jgi:hypothetical protein